MRLPFTDFRKRMVTLGIQAFRQLNHRLGHLDFDSIYFFIEIRQGESFVDDNFAPLCYCSENAVAKPENDN